MVQMGQVQAESLALREPPQQDRQGERVGSSRKGQENQVTLCAGGQMLEEQCYAIVNVGTFFGRMVAVKGLEPPTQRL